MICNVYDDEDDMVVGYKNINDNYLKTMGMIVKKYIALNEYSKNYIQKSIKNIFSDDCDFNKILAVHVRGTDFSLHWNNHPNIVQVEDFFIAIDEAIVKGNFDYIFLATDDSKRLELFKKKYGSKLKYFEDVHRSDGEINVSFEKYDRVHNNYFNGLEVLRDIYTMAYCGGLIAGLSQVSICSRIVNRSLDEQFKYEKIIDKGICKL